MNKQELKKKLIEIADTIDKQVGEMMSPSCDEQTGKIRTEVYRELSKTHSKLKQHINEIY